MYLCVFSVCTFSPSSWACVCPWWELAFASPLVLSLLGNNVAQSKLCVCWRSNPPSIDAYRHTVSTAVTRLVSHSKDRLWCVCLRYPIALCCVNILCGVCVYCSLFTLQQHVFLSYFPSTLAFCLFLISDLDASSFFSYLSSAGKFLTQLTFTQACNSRLKMAGSSSGAGSGDARCRCIVVRGDVDFA